jgi:glycine/D-amino acid oxidase-like deaminating enzyme
VNTRPTTGPWGTENCKRNRILVDEERASRVLQRRKGDVVAGGGSRVEFGGSSTFISAVTLLEDQQNGNTIYQSSPSSLLLELTGKLAPSAIKDVESARICHAVRSMSKDGLPVVGFQQNNRFYTVVAHSGITLGPLLVRLNWKLRKSLNPFRWRFCNPTAQLDSILVQFNSKYHPSNQRLSTMLGCDL